MDPHAGEVRRARGNRGTGFARRSRDETAQGQQQQQAARPGVHQTLEMQARMLKRQKPERQSRRLPRVVRARAGVAFSRHQLGGNMRLTMFAAAAAFAMSTAHAATTYEGN